MNGDMPFSCSGCQSLSVLTTGPCYGEVRMILWPTLPQPNPFLTMLVDPNGPTRGGWCEGDVLPRHRYWLHRQTVAWEPGLLLLGAFRETPHSSEGKLIQNQQSMWLTLVNEQACDISISIHVCASAHGFACKDECMGLFSFFVLSRQYNITLIVFGLPTSTKNIHFFKWDDWFCQISARCHVSTHQKSLHCISDVNEKIETTIIQKKCYIFSNISHCATKKKESEQRK